MQFFLLHNKTHFTYTSKSRKWLSHVLKGIENTGIKTSIGTKNEQIVSQEKKGVKCKSFEFIHSRTKDIKNIWKTFLVLSYSLCLKIIFPLLLFSFFSFFFFFSVFLFLFSLFRFLRTFPRRYFFCQLHYYNLDTHVRYLLYNLYKTVSDNNHKHIQRELGHNNSTT